MSKQTQFFIAGKWLDRASRRRFPVISPATEEPVGEIALGTAEDVDAAVMAARAALQLWAATPLAERVRLVRKLAEIYEARIEALARAISSEMGAPITLSRTAQAPSGLTHLKTFLVEVGRLEFERPLRSELPHEYIIREPIGVCGLITPWNWPMNQVCLKVPPALLVGCTVVLKPSENAPLSSLLFAEMIEEAGFPPGVFNLVNGDGLGAGAALAAHPGVDMVSFTGSCRAGASIGQTAATTFKRVTLELGGKSPNIIFADADVEAAARRGARSVFTNSGQSCDAPTRMLVERSAYDRAVAAAAATAAETAVGDPAEEGPHIGPVSSKRQFVSVQKYIESGVRQGARLVVGGLGRPDRIAKGWFVRPTVFADARNDMLIAREEIFGPVLSIIPFDTEEEAIGIANATDYGLASYIQSGDPDRIRRVARQIRAGVVRVNGASRGAACPFGGYKHSGNGREAGLFGLEEYLEVKAISGWPTA